MVVVAGGRIQKEVVHRIRIDLAARRHIDRVEEHRRHVNRRHAQSHRDHQQRLKHALATEVDQQEAEQHQKNPGDCDSRLVGERGHHHPHALKDIKPIGIHDSSSPVGGSVFDHREQRTGLNLFAFLDLTAGQHAGNRSGHHRLHLHRLQHKDRFALLDR